MNLHVILYQPEIPPNTGNVIRLCANTGAQLHLIEPLGFKVTDTRLKRAGLDYHEYAQLMTHATLDAFIATVQPNRLLAPTTQGTVGFTEMRYQPGDALLFGPETRGLPQDILERIACHHRLRIPMQPGNRSLNLSNAVAVMIYEVWRQWGFNQTGR